LGRLFAFHRLGYVGFGSLCGRKYLGEQEIKEVRQ
jgi:hypothetical protein